jgi:hypothetical protein
VPDPGALGVGQPTVETWIKNKLISSLYTCKELLELKKKPKQYYKSWGSWIERKLLYTYTSCRYNLNMKNDY